MKFTTTVAALFAFAASVSAQGISVINPIAGAQWKAGTTQTITWTVTNATTITNIVLRQGDASNLDTVYTITSEQIPASALQYQWAIDANTPAGNDYSVAVDTDLGEQYSPYFVIAAADAAPSSAAGASSAAPSASASAVVSSSAPVSASVPVSSSAAPSSSVKNAPSSSSKPSSSTSATPSQEAAATSVKASLALGVAAAGAVLALL